MPVALLCMINGDICVQTVQSINTELSVFFEYNRSAWTIEMSLAFWIITHSPSSTSLFDRDRENCWFLPGSRSGIYTSSQCIIRLLGWNQQKGSGRRFSLISFSTRHVLKCSCSRQPRVQDQFAGTTSIGRFCCLLPEHKTHAATSAGHSIKFNVLTSLQCIYSCSPQNFLYLFGAIIISLAKCRYSYRIFRYYVLLIQKL